MIPSPGRIVKYTLNEHDALAINKRRKDAHTTGVSRLEMGLIVHAGNPASAGDECPLVITRVWNESTGTVNGQVLLDGNDTLWVTSRVEGEGEGHWEPFPK